MEASGGVETVKVSLDSHVETQHCNETRPQCIRKFAVQPVDGTLLPSRWNDRNGLREFRASTESIESAEATNERFLKRTFMIRRLADQTPVGGCTNREFSSISLMFRIVMQLSIELAASSAVSQKSVRSMKSIPEVDAE